MDHHLKFRLDLIKQSSSTLGQMPPSRYPVSSAPMLFRSKCKPVPLGSEEATNESAPPDSPPSRIRRPQPGAKEGHQPQKQVKQLQFWLKVFSRFCQDPGEEE
jgi:hypothetical protein